MLKYSDNNKYVICPICEKKLQYNNTNISKFILNENKIKCKNPKCNYVFSEEESEDINSNVIVQKRI